MTLRTQRWLFPLFLLFAFALALAFRLPRLHERPMHVDEAVQAFKTGILLDQGDYCYDPEEYHGPTLHYIVKPVLRLTGTRQFKDTRETQYRAVTAVTGALLVLLFWGIGDGLGRPAAVCAAFLTAVSPAMVFYSRYYIHETLLVFFTFAMLSFAWRHTRREKVGWAVLAGLSAGLVYATKETCVLTFVSVLVSLGLMEAWTHLMDRRRLHIHKDLPSKHHFFPFVLGCVTAALLFSAFLTHPEGPINAIKTHFISLHRAGPGGYHEHPWYYYFKMLLWTRHDRGPWFSEAYIVLLSAVGFVWILTRRGHHEAPILLKRFLAFYVLVLAGLYSAVPYKTPWCVLSFLHGMTLLAGVGAIALITLARKWPFQLLVGGLLLAGFFQLNEISRRTNFKFCADRRNPYVYAHTQMGFLKLAQRVEDLANVHPQGHQMLVKIISPHYWPLPWYLRKFDHVGYWDHPDAHPKEHPLDAPLIVTCPDLMEQVSSQLQEEYQLDSYYPLWPEEFVVPYIQKDLWDAFMATRMNPSPTTQPSLNRRNES